MSGDDHLLCRITVRQFESPAPEFSQLVTHSDNSSAAYYTVSGLAPASPYTVCLEPVILEAETEARGRQCREFSTLASSLSTVTQVSRDVFGLEKMLISLSPGCGGHGSVQFRHGAPGGGGLLLLLQKAEEGGQGGGGLTLLRTPGCQ